jgi:hypothetical protein
LKIRDKELMRLESNGVDNWEGNREGEITATENYNAEHGTDYEYLDECLEHVVALEMNDYETV